MKKLRRSTIALALGLFLPFTALTYRIVSSGSAGGVRNRPVSLTTLATITVPFVGTIARDGQSCCLAISCWLAVILGPVVAEGAVAQVIPLPLGRWNPGLRIGLWSLAWFAWFSGGLVSFGHAVS